MNKKYVSILIAGSFILTISLAALGINRFSGMNKEQKITSRDELITKVEQIKTENKKLNEKYFNSDDGKNKVESMNLKPESKKILDDIRKNDGEITKYESELLELSQDEDIINYSNEFQKGIEGLKNAIEDSNLSIKNGEIIGKDIKIVEDTNKKRETLIKKYEQKSKDKNIDIKKTYTDFRSESDKITQDMRNQIWVK